MKRYDAAALERWTTGAFAACGMPPDDAALAAATVVRSELRGYGTHGLTRIASYVERLRSGEMNPRPDMRHREAPGAIVLDADGAMGHVAGPRAVSLAVAALEPVPRCSSPSSIAATWARSGFTRCLRPRRARFA